MCDRDANGHEVWARYIYILPPHQYEASTPSDPNGSASGCGNFTPDPFYDAFRLCVQFEGCGPYKSVY